MDSGHYPDPAVRGHTHDVPAAGFLRTPCQETASALGHLSDGATPHVALGALPFREAWSLKAGRGHDQPPANPLLSRFLVLVFLSLFSNPDLVHPGLSLPTTPWVYAVMSRDTSVVSPSRGVMASSARDPGRC